MQNAVHSLKSRSIQQLHFFSARTNSRDMNMKFTRSTLLQDHDIVRQGYRYKLQWCYILRALVDLWHGCVSIFGHVVATILLVLKCSVALISGSHRKIATAAIKSILCHSQRFMAIAADLFWLRPATNYKAINVYVVLSVHSVLSAYCDDFVYTN